MTKPKWTIISFIIALTLIGCTAHDAVPGPAGKDAQPCSVSSTAVGAVIRCPDGSESVVYNGANGEQGLPGTNGYSCTVAQLDTGAVVTCSNGSSATINNGTDGQNGSSCSVTQTDTGATINCSDGSYADITNGSVVTVKHGHDK